MKRYQWKHKLTGISGRYLLVYWLLCVFPVAATAQTVTATVSRNPVGVNEQFELKYTVAGSVTRFKPPSLDDFGILSGPNQAQSVQFINGSMSQYITFSYILQPKKEGTFKIEPARIESGGKDVPSNSIDLVVVKGQGGAASQQGKQQNQPEKTNISDKNIFFRVEVDKSTVYRGEGIAVTYKLYTNVSLVNYKISKLPSLDGFWSHELDIPPQLQLQNETFNGVAYKVGTIKKAIIYPQQSGTLIIDPMEGEVIARVQVKRTRSNNPFDIFNDPFFNDPFFGAGGYRDIRYAVKSAPIRITVKDLPPNPPASFKGAVGRFSMEAGIDKLKPKTNDAVTLKMRISGNGNLKLLEPPDITFPGDIETYDPKTADNIAFTMNGASGSRSFEYLMIPRVPGKYELGEVAFSYFDPSKKSYVTIKKGPFTLDVAKGADGGYASTGTGKADFKVIGRDIRYIKTNTPNYITLGSGFVGSALFWALLLLPVALFGGALMYQRKHRESLQNATLLRARKAGQAARKRLAGAKKALDAGDLNGFYEGTSKALWDYAGHKLNLAQSNLTRDLVAERLAAAGTDAEQIRRFGTLLDRCEMSRFAGTRLEQSPDQFYEEAVDLITKIENGTSR